MADDILKQIQDTMAEAAADAEEIKKLRRQYLKEEAKGYQDLKKESARLQNEEAKLNKEVADALKTNQKTEQEIAKKQKDLNEYREAMKDEEISNEEQEIANLKERAKQEKQSHQAIVKQTKVASDQRKSELDAYTKASLEIESKASEEAKKISEAQKSDAQKTKELAAKHDKLEKIKKTQLDKWQGLAVGVNKSLVGAVEGIKEKFASTTVGKITGFMGWHKIGKDDTLEKQQKAVEAEQNIRAEAKSKGKVLSDEDVQKKVAERTAEPEKASKLVNFLSFGNLAKGLEQQKTLAKAEAIDTTKESNTPQKVEIVAQPKPEKDAFAEEKANEAAYIQSEQAETQERMADALEKQQEDQSVKVEGKDTGIFGKILGGKFNPLKALQGMVSGIFGIIEEFIKGIGNVLKAALGVVEKLVKGIGEILLSIVDIIGKGFVKLMTFAGQGIAALFKALGSIPPQALLIGAAAIGVLTLAFMGLGKGLQMMTPAIKELATIPFDNFLSLAGGLLVLTPALIAFGVGAAIATPGFLGLALGVGALGLAMRVLAPAIETIVPPITAMLSSFGDFLSTLQGIVSKFFTTIGDFIATVGTAISDFISNFAQSLVTMNDANFVHLAAGFVALGVALAAFGATAWVAIPSLIALGKASSGLADLIDVPPDRFDALRESFKLLGKAVKGFAKDAKGLGSTVVAMGALSMMPFARKLLDVQLAKTETRNVVDNFKGGVAEAIQPVDIVSFSGARTERGVEMLRQASETAEIRDETAMNASGANVVTTAVTDASSVTNNAIVVQDSPTNSSFRASASTY